MPRSIIHGIEKAWDGLKQDLGARLSRDTPLIAPYRGFGTADELWFRGRVLEDEGVMSALHSDSLLVNLRHTWNRYETDELPGARVSWRLGEDAGEVVTDEEGYFDASFRPTGLADAPWQELHLLLEAVPGYDVEPLGATLPIRTPGADARFGVISDIDDTIVYTGAHDFLKHWRTVVANSAQSRETYDGVADLYAALTQDERNPIFYVSSSPWNLFDLFERYMALNGIPLGPMLLRDFGLDDTKWLTGGHHDHKGAAIDRVMGTYPHLPFVLIGDSGQQDPLVYAAAAERHGKRVAAVLIHEVTPDADAPTVAEMRERLGDAVPHMVTTSYMRAHEWLRELGFADAVPVEPARATDRAARP